MDGGAWNAAVHGVAEGRTRLRDFTFTFHFHALEKEMATHSSVLAWRIPGTGEPDGLPSMGSHRVGHDWSDSAAAAAAACWMTTHRIPSSLSKNKEMKDTVCPSSALPPVPCSWYVPKKGKERDKDGRGKEGMEGKREEERRGKERRGSKWWWVSNITFESKANTLVKKSASTGREVGGGFRMGNTCMPVADSCWCVAEPIQYCKVISLQLK